MTAEPDRRPEDDARDEAKRRAEEKELDKALSDSFPASDPPAIVQPTPSPEQDRKPKNKARRH